VKKDYFYVLTLLTLIPACSGNTSQSEPNNDVQETDVSVQSDSVASTADALQKEASTLLNDETDAATLTETADAFQKEASTLLNDETDAETADVVDSATDTVVVYDTNYPPPDSMARTIEETFPTLGSNTYNEVDFVNGFVAVNYVDPYICSTDKTFMNIAVDPNQYMYGSSLTPVAGSPAVYCKPCVYASVPSHTAVITPLTWGNTNAPFWCVAQ
jgi:hypothetical protein